HNGCSACEARGMACRIATHVPVRSTGRRGRVIQRRDWLQYGSLLPLCLEEDKKRGYGLIGKTTILHIVNSGSRPDISIFFYKPPRQGLRLKRGEPSLC